MNITRVKSNASTPPTVDDSVGVAIPTKIEPRSIMISDKREYRTNLYT